MYSVFERRMQGSRPIPPLSVCVSLRVGKLDHGLNSCAVADGMEGITNCKYLIISFVSGTGAAANPSLCIIHTIVYSILPRAILQLLLVTSANA